MPSTMHHRARSFRDVIATLRQHLLAPAVAASVAVLLTMIFLRVATPLYEARISITGRAVENQPLRELGRGLGLEMLAGLGRGASLTSYDKLVEVLASSDTAEQIRRDEALMRQLFPGDWDPASQSWIRPSGFGAAARRTLNRIFGLPAWNDPGSEPIMDLMKKRMRVTANDAGRYHTISFRHPDAELARRTIDRVLGSADQLLRSRDLTMVTENITFLRERLGREQLVDVREVLSRQMGEEFVRAAMLANSAPYAYETIETLTVSSKPVSPRPLLSLVLAALAGAILGAAWVLLLPHDAVPPRHGEAERRPAL